MKLMEITVDVVAIIGVIGLFQTHAVGGGELTWTPLNVVTKVGNSVTLTCAGTKLSWVEYITNPGSSVSKTITAGINIQNKSKYGLNTDPDGKYELVIKSPVLSDGGRYRCKDIWNEANRGDAELIVFESDPVCKNNITSNEAVEGEYIEYSCEVTYKGKWAPVMEWKNGRTVLQANGESKDESTGKTVKYTYVTKLTPEDNGQIFTCRTYFDQPKPGTVQDKEADNIPTTDNVLTKYTSPQLTFYYGPQMLMVEPERDTYYPGDTIKVTTESNPSNRTYEWVNTSTDAILGREDTFIITEEMLGSQSLKVIVCNTIPIPHANTNYKERQLHFTVIHGSGPSTDKTGKQTLTTGAIVGISLGTVAFIIILICCCVYFICKHKSDESHEMHMVSIHREQQVPVDQVKSTDNLKPMDSAHPPTPEDITYADQEIMHDNQADPAIDDVLQSCKPLLLINPSSEVEYASI